MAIVASNNITVSNVNDGTITHTAWSYSADGTDRFTTVYPNLNLIEDGKFAKPISSNWYIDGTTISKDDITGYFKVKFNGAGSLNRVYYGGSISTIQIGQKYSVYIKAYSLESSLNIKLGSVNTSQAVTITNNSNSPKTYKIEGLVRGASNTFGLFGGLTTTIGTLFISEIKLEPGSTATPYMPSSSEVTTADWPSYIGQYSDFTSTVSTDPAKYAPWTIFKGNDGVGVTSTDITYAISTSGTTAPSTGWTSSVPTLVKGQYLWTKTAWTYTDNSSKTGYSVTYISKDGTNGTDGTDGTDGTSGIIVSSVAPASPQNGQLWQDTSTTPQLVKKWTGSSWVIWELYAQNLKSDSLETVSSKIGNIYNDFTLEDGTTGTLHIGSSEYRIDSQMLEYGYLFKENIFFDPDGLSFSFEGNTASNTGHGNYTKSGSDFYLQNNQMASYTVSGIRMSNEFAGYSIQIGNADRKMSFVSENGQGFNFTGPVSFNGVPMNTTSSISVALFYDITIIFRRQGNLVTASIDRQTRTISTTGENIMTNEKVPSGYRPSYSHYFEINRNSGSNVIKGLIMGIASNGDVRVTIGETGIAVLSGSTSYFTTDPLP